MMASDRLLPFEIDHIIAEKHGGITDADNLCLACYRCNSFKRSDIVSADPETGAATYLFHPRRQKWNEYFALEAGMLRPLTPEGRVTVFLLRLNLPIQVEQRRNLIEIGLYPC
jgi:hypothetical protein